MEVQDYRARDFNEGRLENGSGLHSSIISYPNRAIL